MSESGELSSGREQLRLKPWTVAFKRFLTRTDDVVCLSPRTDRERSDTQGHLAFFVAHLHDSKAPEILRTIESSVDSRNIRRMGAALTMGNIFKAINEKIAERRMKPHFDTYSAVSAAGIIIEDKRMYWQQAGDVGIWHLRGHRWREVAAPKVTETENGLKVYDVLNGARDFIANAGEMRVRRGDVILVATGSLLNIVSPEQIITSAQGDLLHNFETLNVPPEVSAAATVLRIA